MFTHLSYQSQNWSQLELRYPQVRVKVKYQEELKGFIEN